jgi:hypothetical protein
MIKTYSAEGPRRRDFSETAIARLLALRRVVLTYSTKGRLLHATFLPHDGAPVLRTAHMGQKYSYREPLGDGLHAWKHSDMLSPASIEKLAGRPLIQAEIERELMAIFRRVCLDCMPANDARPAA